MQAKVAVHTHNDSRKALLDFEPNFYDLLLIDINMPYMDGFQFFVQRFYPINFSCTLRINGPIIFVFTFKSECSAFNLQSIQRLIVSFLDEIYPIAVK